MYILTCFLLFFISYLYFFAASLQFYTQYLLPLSLYLIFVFVFLCSIVALAASFLPPSSLVQTLFCIWALYLWLRILESVPYFKSQFSNLSFPSSIHYKPLLKYCSKMDRLFLLNTVCVLSRSMAYRWGTILPCPHSLLKLKAEGSQNHLHFK